MFISPFIQQETQPQGLFTFWDLYPGVFGKFTVYTIIIGLIFTLFLVIKIIGNAFVPKEKKTLWMVLLILGNIFVLPFFWFINIRKQSVAG
jgi:hypothetical protein